MCAFYLTDKSFCPTISNSCLLLPCCLHGSCFVPDDAKVAVDTDDTDDEGGAPRISLAEMLDDLRITEDATGGEGAEMVE